VIISKDLQADLKGELIKILFETQLALRHSIAVRAKLF